MRRFLMSSLIKTPLRYPGGKSRLVKYLKDYLPNSEWNEYREVFLGGASFFIYMKQTYPDKQYWINDKYYNLYCFWKELQQNSTELSNAILSKKKEYPDNIVGRNLFEKCLDILKTSKDEFQIACAFYIVNKCSFSGLTENSSYAPQAYVQNFSDNGIINLQKYTDILKGVKITNLDYSEVLTNDEKTFIYLDPPYDIKHALYGNNKGSLHRMFNHEDFRNSINECKCKWLISYNDNEYIRELFSTYNIYNFDTKYVMRCSGKKSEIKQSKKSTELIIKNY